MICKIGLCVMVALAVATCSDADRNKLGGVGRIRLGRRFGFGSGGSAAASAAAGPNGVSSSAAASIPNSQFAYGSPYAPHVHYPAPPVHYPAPPVHYPAPPANYHSQSRYPSYPSEGPYLGKAAKQHYASLPPRDTFRSDPYAYSRLPGYNRHENRDQGYPAPGSYGKFKGYPESVYSSPDTATWSAAAAATAGGLKHGRGDSAVAAAAASGWNQQQHYAPEYQYRDIDEEEGHEHYYAPESEEYRATAGAYNNGPRNNYEEGSRKSETEVVSNQESGSEDGDHLYKANSFGRTSDEDHNTIFNDSNSEKTKTRDLLHERKSNTNFVSTSKKRTQETGSGVHAQNRHSVKYNKDYNKLKDKVDQKYTKRADGLVETNESNSNTDMEDEDVMRFDTRGLGAHGKPASVGQPNHASPAASASASASAFSSAGR